MKRIILLILIILAGFSLVGCNNTSKEKTPIKLEANVETIVLQGSKGWTTLRVNPIDYSSNTAIPKEYQIIFEGTVEINGAKYLWDLTETYLEFVYIDGNSLSIQHYSFNGENLFFYEYNLYIKNGETTKVQANKELAFVYLTKTLKRSENK